MPAESVPRSLSVYRGQTRHGIGEGPGSGVPQGEQYLDAAAELCDARLLREIRPWMTLDSDSAHHGKLSDRLEGWSLFPAPGGRLFVARLASAGNYRERAAYFAHGRAWDEEQCRNGFDPGLLLGNAGAFDPPWRDREPGTHVPGEIPGDAAAVRKSDAPEVVERFLAFLLQGMATARPIVVAVPLERFVAGSPLPARLALARAALPLAFKKRCRIRIYTQSPEHFLGSLRTDLLVVPEDLRGATRAVRGDALVLDENGHCDNASPDPRAAEYARAVLQEVQRRPEGLLPFTERFSARYTADGRRLPERDNLRFVQVVYYVAYGLAGPDELRGGLLNRYLFETAQTAELPWAKLVDTEEWTRFPSQDLARFLLRTDGRHPERLRALQASIDEALRESSDTFRSSLRTALKEELGRLGDQEGEKAVERLLRLLAAGLLGKPAIAHLSRLSPKAVAGYLRRFPRHVRDLARETSAGTLAPAWAEPLLDDASSESWNELAQHLLSSPETWSRWSRVPHRVLDRFLAEPPDPARWTESVQRAGERIGDEDDVEILIRLVELQQRMTGERPPLLPKLLERIGRLERPDLQDKVLLEYVLNEEWLSLPRHLAVRGGWPWLKRHEGLLLEDPGVRGELSTERLLELAATRLEDDAGPREVFAEIDKRMIRDAGATTKALVRTGWWPYWRRLSGLTDPSEAAAAWLACDAWQESGTPEATREAWTQALEDAGALCADRMASLLPEGRPHWPWIPPFEEEQIAELGRACRDVDALAELIDGIAGCSRLADLESSPAVLATLDADLETLGLGPGFPADGLLWLVGTERRPEAPVLPLDESRRLYERTARRRERGALPARTASVLAHLERSPLEAVEAAGRPDLWGDERFLNGLGQWLARHEDVAGFGGLPVARKVEERLLPEARCVGGRASARLLQDLEEKGLKKIRGFLRRLSPEEERAERLIDAICRNDASDPIWTELSKAAQSGWREDGHPFFALADAIQEMPIDANKRALLETASWPLIDTVTQNNHSSFFWNARDEEPLPLFELVRSLRRRGSAGDIAAGIVLAHGCGNRHQPEWWKALLHGLRRPQAGFQRLEDHPVRVLQLVERCIKNLPSREQNAWEKASRGLFPDGPTSNHGDLL